MDVSDVYLCRQCCFTSWLCRGPCNCSCNSSQVPAKKNPTISAQIYSRRELRLLSMYFLILSRSWYYLPISWAETHLLQIYFQTSNYADIPALEKYYWHQWFILTLISESYHMNRCLWKPPQDMKCWMLVGFNSNMRLIISASIRT